MANGFTYSPSDAYSTPEPERCHCGAIEDAAGDFQVCVDCQQVLCAPHAIPVNPYKPADAVVCENCAEGRFEHHCSRRMWS